jgi:hypothetical protein
MVGALPAMVRLQHSGADWVGEVMESVTVKQTRLLPATVGVPESTPAALSVMPAGTPESTVQVCPVPEPPEMVNCTPLALPLYRAFTSAVAGEKHCGCGGVTTVSVQHLVVDWLKLSVSFKHICELLVAVSVPATVQVPGVSERPAGSVPLTVQVVGEVPPLAVKAPE